jgi:hypothetical protein
MSNPPDQSRSISDLRETLFDVIADVRSGKLDVEKAKAVNGLASSIIDTAKVEVDYLRINDGGESAFIDAIGDKSLPPGVVRHRLR